MPFDGNVDRRSNLEILRDLCATNQYRSQSSFASCLLCEAVQHPTLVARGILETGVPTDVIDGRKAYAVERVARSSFAAACRTGEYVSVFENLYRFFGVAEEDFAVVPFGGFDKVNKLYAIDRVLEKIGGRVHAV